MTGSVSLFNQKLDHGFLKVRFESDSAAKKLEIQPYLMAPERGSYMLSRDSMASIDFPAQSVVKSYVCEIVKRNDIPVMGNSELILCSNVYSVIPAAIFTANRFELELRMPKKMLDNKHIGLFEWSGKQWLFCDRNVNIDKGLLKAKSLVLKPFAAFKDTVSPKINDISVSDNKIFYSAPDIITFTIMENGSGIISDLQIKTTIDKKIWINEYDPERNKVTILKTHKLTPGSHVLEISVKDALENLASKTITFKIKRR